MSTILGTLCVPTSGDSCVFKLAGTLCVSTSGDRCVFKLAGTLSVSACNENCRDGCTLTSNTV